MSSCAKDCNIYVDANGRYCVRDKIIRLTDRPVAIHVANCPAFELLVYPTGDTDDVAVPSGIIINPGTNSLHTPGVYGFPDLSALDGTDAPADPTLHKSICCSKPTEENFLALILDCFVQLKNRPQQVTEKSYCWLSEDADGCVTRHYFTAYTEVLPDGTWELSLIHI